MFFLFIFDNERLTTLFFLKKSILFSKLTPKKRGQVKCMGFCKKREK